MKKTYRYATKEIQKLQDNLAQSHNENDEEKTDPEILRDYCRSSSSGRLKNDFIDMKKENQALKEKNGFAERDLVLLQEEYDSIKGKLEKCAMANEKLLESNNSLKAKSKQLEKENQDLADSQNDSKWFQGKIHDYQTQINELEKSQINCGNNLISIEVLKARINEVENSRKKLKEKNGQLMNRVEALNQACGDNGKFQEQIKDLKFKNSELKNQLDGAIWEIENLRQEYDESKNQLTSQWKEICEKNEALEKRIDGFKSENADLENNLDVASWEIENLRKDCDSSQKLINRGGKYLETQDMEITQLKYEKACLKEEISGLKKEIEDLYQDFNYYEKFILRARASLENLVIQELQRLENSPRKTEKQTSISYISVSDHVLFRKCWMQKALSRLRSAFTMPI